MSEIVIIPLEQIIPNPKQPRSYISPESIQTMADSLKEIGQETPVKVRPLTDAELAIHSPAQYMLIGGHTRWEGAKAAGLTSLEAIIQNRTPEQVKVSAFMDNQSEDMTWLDTDLAIADLVPILGGQRKAAAKLGLSPSKVNIAVSIVDVLTPTSQALIAQSVYRVNTENKGFLVTERHLRALTGLDSPEDVEKALKVVIDGQMSPTQASAMVTNIKEGTPAEAHVAAPKPPRAVKPAQAAEQVAPTRTQPPVHHDQPAKQAEASAQVPTASSSPSNQMNTAETVAYDTLAGVSLIARIKTKLKKGEKPTAAETLLLAAHALWTVLHWLGKHGFKLVKWVLKEIGRLIKDAFKELWKLLGPIIRKIVGFIFVVVFFGGAFWLVWDIHEHGLMHPIRLAEAKLFALKPTPEPTQMPTPIPTVVPTVVPTTVVDTPVPTAIPTAVPAPVVSKHKKAKVVAAVPTQALVQPTPTVQKKDVVGDAAGSVAKSVAPDLAADAAKKLFGL